MCIFRSASDNQTDHRLVVFWRNHIDKTLCDIEASIVDAGDYSEIIFTVLIDVAEEPRSPDPSVTAV